MEIQDGNQSNKPKIDLKDVSKDTAYQAYLDKKVNSIMGGQDTMPYMDLVKRSPSIFIPSVKKDCSTLLGIANLDGDAMSFSREEVKILITLKEADLETGANGAKKLVVSPHEDYPPYGRSGLSDASESDIEGLIKSYEKNPQKADAEIQNYRAGIQLTKVVDEQQFRDKNSEFEERNKPLEQKLQSTNPNDVLKAINDETMTDFVDPKTGQKVNIIDVPVKFDTYIRQALKNKTSDEELFKKFEAETGVKISKLDTYGSGKYTYKVGDYSVKFPAVRDKGQYITIDNLKTGVSVLGRQLEWEPQNNNAVPNQKGAFFCIFNYADRKAGVSAKFFDDRDQSPSLVYSHVFEQQGSIQPKVGYITIMGDTNSITYEPNKKIDYSLYHFTPAE